MTNSPSGETQPRAGLDSFFDQLRRIPLRRDTDHSWLGGVCSGLAARFGLDPTVVRALAVLLALLLGAGVLIYLLAWLFVPAQDERTHLERALRHGEGGPVFLLVVTALATLGGFPWWIGDGFLGGWSIIGLVLAALVIWTIYYALQERAPKGGYWQSSPHGPPPPGAVPPPGPWYSTGPATPAAHQAAPTTDHGAPMTPMTDETRPMPLAGASGDADPATRGGDTAPLGTAVPGAGNPPSSWASAGGPQPPGVPPSGPVPPSGGGPGYPPPPSKVRRPTGGVTVALIVTGLALLAYGIVLWLGGEYGWPGNHHVVGIASALFVAGGAVLILGATGRRSGFPGVLAVVLLVMTLVTAPLPPRIGFVTGRVGDEVWRPASVAAGDSFSLAAGEGTLDLTQLDPGEIEADNLPVAVGFGELTIRVPEDLTVEIRSAATYGEITVEQPDGRQRTGGIGPTETVTIGDGPVDLRIDAQVTAGEIIIERD